MIRDVGNIQGVNAIPDEEGIETWEAHRRITGEFPRVNAIPDEEGIETHTLLSF